MAKDSRKFCISCYDKYIVPRCHICNKKLEKNGLSVQGNKNLFCKSCNERYDHCKGCGIPVKNAANSEVGFPLCLGCNIKTVSSDSKLREIFDRVRAIAKDELGLEVKFNTKRIYLASNYELVKLTESMEISAKDPLGICQPEYFFNILKRQTIYIQNGMPPIMVFDTLAHEYAHAWHNVNGNLKAELIFEEGFCEWVAYKCLLKAGYTERAKRKLENKDPIYGLGLRKMLTLEKRLGGKEKLLQYVRTKTSF